MQLTRGEIMDYLAKFSSENDDYRKALVSNPKEVVTKQFGMEIPDDVSLKVVEDTADTVHVILPHVVATGAELSDADLEAVAGGGTTVKEATCEGGGSFNTVIGMEASLGF